MRMTNYFVKGRSPEALVHGVNAGYDDPELLLTQLDYCQALLEEAFDLTQKEALTAQILTITTALDKLTR